MISWQRVVCVLGFAALGVCVAAARDPEIPYRKYVLDNGLTLLVHEDHKAPVVAVNVWYHVGAKDEVPGRTGFAHLFEHLMFNGSAHFNDDYFKALERVGATGMNGTTGEDRTNYFQNVPREALDLALWMESDRMGFLLAAVSQERLDEQRGVVLNEKRQHENSPYAVAYRLITHNTWPAGHPYSWEVIGSEADLKAATLDDVRDWFTRYYGAANAVVVVAGDVAADEAFAKVKRAFGKIPSGPPLNRQAEYVAKRHGTRRMWAQDRVPQSRVYQVWNIPPYGTTAAIRLDLAADLLASGKSSRLYKRLVHDEQIATDVSVYADLREIAGQFVIVATAKPGVALSRVEQVIDEELVRFLDGGPSDEELRRVKVQSEARFVRGCERVGGFGGKSDILASNFVLTGNPDYYRTILDETRQATGPEIRATAREWLSEGAFVLQVEPFPEYATAADDVDRRSPPFPDIKPAARFPEVCRATLSNGLKVVVAERHETPLVQFSLVVGVGFAADAAALPGTASLMAEMLDEGTRRRDALTISREADLLGAQLGVGCSLDTTVVSLNTLKRQLDPALDLYADVILNPVFPDSEFARLRNERLASIRREKADPNGIAQRILPELLFGKGHAYGNPFNGGGDEADVSRVTRDDIARFYTSWFKPNNATLIVTGDTSLNELLPKLERRFAAWKVGELPSLTVTDVAPRTHPVVYLVDRPSAPQAVIYAAGVASPWSLPEEYAVEVASTILGGSFTSRVNMNLREDKHWSYGARTRLTDACAGPRAFICTAPVQADKAGDAMRELDREFRGLGKEAPPTEREVNKVVTDRTLQLSGRWETIGAVAESLEQAVRFKLPEDYYQTYAAALCALTPDAVARAVPRVVNPDSLVWLVIGDRTKMMAQLTRLNWGAVTVLTPDGEPVK